MRALTFDRFLGLVGTFSGLVGTVRGVIALYYTMQPELRFQAAERAAQEKAAARAASEAEWLRKHEARCRERCSEALEVRLCLQPREPGHEEYCKARFPDAAEVERCLYPQEPG
jgi:hypothetical protein